MSEPRKEALAEGVEIWLGDCREVLLLIDKADAVVSDVPYGVKFDCGWANEFRGVRIAGDQSTGARDAVIEWAGDRPALLFGSWKIEKPKQTKITLIWDKGTVGMGDLSLPWFPCTEEIYVLGGGFVGSRTSSVSRYVGRNEFHPTEKPVPLMMELVWKCDPDWIVLDPFMGSGTTGVACVNLGRSFIGIEIESKHFDVARRRISEALASPRLPFDSPKPPKQEAPEL